MYFLFIIGVQIGQDDDERKKLTLKKKTKFKDNAQE